MGMKIYFLSQNGEEEEEDIEPKNFYKSGENF